jgi:Sigma-70 region 2
MERPIYARDCPCIDPRAILRDDREAEDVLQEAYVNAYVHLAQFDGRAKFNLADEECGP